MSPSAVAPPFVLRRVATALSRPTDPASLAALRVLFGALIAIGSARFLASGFVEKLYCEDAFYFRYWGLSWVPVPGPDTIAVLYGSFVGLGVLIALGLFFRAAMATFTVLFLWVQLVDVTNYLNHYYLVILLGALLTVSPAHAAFSLDARWFGAARSSVPFLFVALLRFQVGLVYVFASWAKLGPDWLLAGQPLGLWLPARDELPLFGALLSVPAFTLLLSWCGFLYDATIVPLLLWRRSRPFAYLLVVVFHGLTRAFFEIGMFPFIMMVATTVFFSPAWPRRFVRERVRAAPSMASPSRAVFALAGLWCAFHVLFPLRSVVLSDDVLWDEAGMRFSWRVMVREKSGSLTYKVTLPDGRVVDMSPHALLSHRQVNEMIGQPDMVLALAHKIRDDYAARGVRVQVRADALVSLNGRTPTRFIDPDVDLAATSDSLGRARFVLPAPDPLPPARLR